MTRSRLSGRRVRSTRGPERAEWLRRLGGLIVDGILLQVVLLPTHRNYWASVGAAFVYNTVLIGAWGRTVGQRVVSVHVAMFEGFERAAFTAALVRAVVVAVGGVVLFGGRAIGGPVGVVIGTIGAIFGLAVYIPIFGEERRGLHDRASGTVVLLDPAS